MGTLSTSTVLRWFQDQPGVLRINKDAKNGKRAHCEVRIPVSIAFREYRERTR
jgi:hypothetical protein